MNTLLKASEARKPIAQINADRWKQWQIEWEKVQDYIANTITQTANFGHSQCKFSLKEVHFEIIAKELEFLRHAFTTRGYEVELNLERSTNGAREIIVKW